MHDFIYLFGFSFLGSVAGILGGVIFIYNKKASHILDHAAVPLAAGVLLAVCFTDLLPEAVASIGNLAFQIVLVVFVVTFLIEKYLFTLHHHEEEKKSLSGAVPLVIFGDTIHNFMDGITIAVAFAVSPSFGFLVAFSTFLHEIPHEIADFGILLSAGWKKRDVLLANFLSSLSTFPGAFIGYYLSYNNNHVNGTLLSISAGLFLYVSATDFLPQLANNSEKSFKQAILLVVGILIIFGVSTLVPEIGR
jgi:zinc and cadmium transporter